jgi:hypothetical protein
MRSGKSGLIAFTAAGILVGSAHAPVLAGVHTWDVNEAFTNASGTIQFIELREAGGGPGETGVPGQSVITNQNSFLIPAPALTPPTSFKHLLFGTAAFAALPGAPAPDYIIPANFFSTALGNTIRFGGLDINFIYGAGALPTNGTHSLNENPALPANPPTAALNSPTNYAGVTGSVNASSPPPAVPDGDGPTIPMLVRKLDAAATMLRLSWDTTSCTPGGSYQVIYGEGSDLPASSGGVFALDAAVCAVPGSPFAWSGVPAAGDGSGLLWWLLTLRDASNREGSWGLDGDGAERLGPGPGGSSGLCGVTTKDATNVCGQ